MNRLNIKSAPFKRAGLAVLIALTIGSVAYAILQSQAKLTGNSIQTSTTGLLISPNDTNYMPAVGGFNFSGIVPGVQASQTEHFLLKNTGTTSLALKVSATGPAANPANVDLDKVRVILTPYSLVTFMPATPQTFSLRSLLDAHASGGTAINYPEKLTPGMKEQFNVQVAMDADAFNGSGASLSNFDLIFSGVGTN